jgi:aryl-alcohol dehydrogenase-like predicted oxidoreductase
MEIRNLGKSGLRVSSIGLGCNNFGGRLDLEGTRKVIHKALDLGITLFDTADTYGDRGGSETLMGQVLGDDRKRIVLATKFGMPMDDVGVKVGGARRYIMSEIEDRLRALDDLITQGKVRYVGCSNLKAWQVVEATWTARSLGINGFVSCQDEYSLLVRDGVERELLPAIEAYGLGLLPYFPLASGLLTGKYRRNAPMPENARLTNTERLANRYLTEGNWARSEKLADFAAGHGHTLLELAFSWLLSHRPVASVIAGATRPEQLEQNIKAGQWRLSTEDLAEIDRLTAG